MLFPTLISGLFFFVFDEYKRYAMFFGMAWAVFVQFGISLVGLFCVMDWGKIEPEEVEELPIGNLETDWDPKDGVSTNGDLTQRLV